MRVKELIKQYIVSQAAPQKPVCMQGLHRAIRQVQTNTVKHFKYSIALLVLTGSLFSANAQNKFWSLQQCIDTALANNLNVLVSANTVQLNNLNINQSKDNLLPTLNGSASEALNVGRSLNPVSYQYSTGTTWNTNFGLTGTLNLFNGLQNLNAIKQSRLNYNASKYDLEDLKYNLTLSTVNDYLQVLYANEAVKIAQQQIDALQSQLDITATFVEVGKKTESDLLQLKSQLSADKLTLVNAQSQLKTTKLNLQQLMNVAVSDSFAIQYNSDIQPEPKPLEDINSIYAQTLSFQPIVKSYQFRTESSAYGVKIAQGAYSPSLLFKGNFGTNYSTASKHTSVQYISSPQNIGYLQSNPSEIVVVNVPEAVASSSAYPIGSQLKDNVNSTFSIGLSIPILNYLQVRNNVKRQQLNLVNAVLNGKIMRLNLRKNVEQAYTDAENANSKYSAAKEEIDAAKASYNNVLSNFENGKITATDLLVNKTAYMKAESDYLQAKYELLFRQKILDYYKGTSLIF